MPLFYCLCTRRIPDVKMIKQPVYAFTMRDELKRIDSILKEHCPFVTSGAQLSEARQYVVAKVIQNIFLTVACVKHTGALTKHELDRAFDIVLSKYLSTDNGFNFNLEQDVGSNKLFYKLRSDLIPACVRVGISEYNVVLHDEYQQ